MKQYKIKDNVDLKELEKFGFENADFNEKYMIRYIADNHNKTFGESPEEHYRTLYFDRKTKEIYSYHDYFDEEISMDKKWIQDLIEKGLVEEQND